MSEFNPNRQSLRQEQPYAAARPEGRGGLVWQPWAMGGGEWRVPQVVTLSDVDVERIAAAVVRLLQTNKG